MGYVVLMVHGRWSSEGWESVGNMVALTLAFGSSRLRNTGVAVKKRETWANTVGVGVIGD